MVTRRHGGLGVVQLLTLMFGFLLASVIIFAFGIWVGRDLAGHREQDDRPIVVRPAERPNKATGLPTVVAAPESTAQIAERRPTRPRYQPPSSTAIRSVPPTRGPLAARTATKRPTVAPTPSVKPRAEATVPSSATWTVQATATNDQVQALVVKHRLQSEGYDAFMAQSEMRGVTWYRVQVGKFTDRKQAEAIAEKLRRSGMSAAFVDRLR